jgi:putative peptidoglycan lipid II flippase
VTEPIRMVRSFMTVGSWTMLSRVAGFVREIIIAAFFGAGPVAEAFQVAFALPNMFRRFFAEGAFNMAFVPMFSKKYEAGDDPEKFAQEAFAFLASLLIGLTLIAQLAMPWLVLAMASGFAGDERFDLAVVFGRICFPYILLISLSALFSGVLNATGRFAVAAAAPVFLNVILVTFMLGAHWNGWDVGLALVWGVPVAGAVQLALVWSAASRAGIRLLPKMPKMTPELKRLMIIAAPAALAGGVVQVNLLVGRQVASYFDGAIQWLAVADRLYQLPLGVVGVAIGVVLLPDLSRRLQSEDTDGGRNAFNRATEFALVLTVPAAVTMALIPDVLVSVLFQRGAFSAADSAATATALAIYAVGLPAFVLQKVLQPLYFAREDTRTPFIFAVVAMILNAGLAVGLAPLIGYVAAAWGTTLSSWAMVTLLWIGSRTMGEAAGIDDRLLRRLPRIVLTSLAMGGIIWAAARLAAPLLQVDFFRYLALLGLVILGVAAYFSIGSALRAFGLADLKGAVRR